MLLAAYAELADGRSRQPGRVSRCVEYLSKAAPCLPVPDAVLQFLERPLVAKARRATLVGSSRRQRSRLRCCGSRTVLVRKPC